MAPNNSMGYATVYKRNIKVYLEQVGKRKTVNTLKRPLSQGIYGN